MSEDALVIVTLADGSVHRLPAPAEWTAMEVIRDMGLPLKAECGGCCACATCHVYVLEGGEHLPAADEEEIDRLDTAQAVRENSRLACRLVLHPGQVLHVAPAPGSEPD